MYVTFDEPPYSISDNGQRYGWNLGGQGKVGKITFRKRFANKAKPGPSGLKQLRLAKRSCLVLPSSS